ncbi:ATP-dependent helicase [Hyphomonas sp. WL0036]|uniref:UvrD-helicase domain-containing protein n=1 Tax=Hyphomonas sediminis TaxID=2866160 RepID=UPI001C7FA9B3|nr:ATP-dependent helicase [Hyphomonas sediminis]
MTAPYCPTDQQKAVIIHDRSAFVTACPGAGKTRTIVERARHLADRTDDKRGVAFLSFTNAAVDELQGRLRLFGLLPSPLFPSFIGTFDRFLWQFLIAPFGIPGCAALPRLVPDKKKWEVKPPFPRAQALTLECFDRTTGVIDADRAGEQGFDTTKRNPAAWETCARRIIERARVKGLVDFDDVRLCVAERLTDTNFAGRIGTALAARFREIVVDEAQDCNPSDLTVVHWLRRSGLTVKVICDPHQSIFQFRGGITNELLGFADTFDPSDRLEMSGNFRSTGAICAAIVSLRPPSARVHKDQAIGKHKDDPTPIHLLSYSGSGVSTAIGAKFTDLVRSLDIQIGHAPVLASRLPSASKAVGQPTLDKTSHMTLLLAKAVMSYHFAFAVGNRREALTDLHRMILFIRGHIDAIGDYHNHLPESGIIDGRWRPDVIAVANELRYEPGETPDQWLARARISVGAGMATGLNVNKRLKSHANLATALAAAPVDAPPPRTIHSAKGLEFPAVCVVMTSQKAGRILDYLEGDTTNGADEDARKIYVAASRAERLLVMAIPKKTAGRMQALLTSVGSAVEIHQI